VDCPVCREPLIVVEREGIELDSCPWCRGLWFDSGELELLAEKAGRECVPGLDAPPEKTDPGEKPRFCPRCDRKLDRTAVGPEPRVTLDHCGAGHGLWFEHGELGSLMGRLSVKPGSHPEALLRFMGETFGPGPGAGVETSVSDIPNRGEEGR
jgi:Zn-finger nucleic acid-binding protein